MVVLYLRTSGRSIRNLYNAQHISRRFSTVGSSKRKTGRNAALGLAVVGVLGLGLQVPLAKYRIGYRDWLEETVPGATGLLGVTLGEEPVLQLTSKELQDAPVEETSVIPIYKEGDAAQPTLLESLPEEAPVPAVTEEVIPEAATPEPVKKKKKKKKVVEEEAPTELVQDEVVPAAVQEVVAPVEIINEEVAPVVDQTAALLAALSDEPAPVEEVVVVTVEATAAAEAVIVDDGPAVEEFVVTPTIITEIASAEVAPGEVVPAEEISAEVLVEDVSVIEDVAAPVAEAVKEPAPIVVQELVVEDDTEVILEALGSLDYEPVLADSILELLVGKAANREKAVIATISRLENAMANVVIEVQKGLEHHNTISVLVSAAKDKAEAVSKATDKKVALADWECIIEGSEAVSKALAKGEAVDAAVKASFGRLADVIERAEKFDLKAPVAAARALLSKSKNDFYTSCQTAQENQVGHALLADYQKSVNNRKQVLENELAILSQHYPNIVDTINRNIEGATHPAQLEELNTLITYLSNKVSRLEKEITEQQEAELDKLKLAAEAQRYEDEKLLEERLKAQSEQLKYEHEMLRHAEVTQAVAEAREEGYAQAEKQAERHRDEMRDKLDRQNQELTSFWSDEASLREAVVEADYQCKLEVANTVLSGVSSTVEKQKQLFLDSQRNKRMLCLATELHNSVVEGEAIDIDSVTSLSKQLHTEYSGDALVKTVTASLPSTPLFSANQLKNRFNDLKKSVKRSALLVDENCGIGSVILSSVVSLLTFNNAYTTHPSEGGSATMYYMTQAEDQLERGDIDQAARSLNQLTGQPRAILQEWLVEARKLLELRQSTKVLLNYAQTKNMG